MTRLATYLPYIAAGVGGWALVNGILHDIFVLRSEHGKQYDRNLLRLLMDGHILITCGLVQILCFKGLMDDDGYVQVIALVATLSMLAYVAMIFPFLKSIVTTLLNGFLLVILLWKMIAG